VVEDAGTGHLVGCCGVGVLQAELDVIQTGLRQFVHPPLVQAHPTGHQVDVEAELSGPCHKRGEVRPGQWFASGEVQLQHAELSYLIQHPVPLGQRQLRSLWDGNRIGAVRAVQRALVGQLGEQAKRPIHG
jgi:hypothetical protein